MKNLRKAFLAVTASLAMSGCASGIYATGGNSGYSSNAGHFNQSASTSRYAGSVANSNLQVLEARRQSGIASCRSQHIRSNGTIISHSSNVIRSYDRAQDGWQKAAAVLSGLGLYANTNSASANFNACVANVNASYQRAVSTEQYRQERYNRYNR